MNSNSKNPRTPLIRHLPAYWRQAHPMNSGSRAKVVAVMFLLGGVLAAQNLPVDQIFATAKLESQKQNKNILVIFGASWCGPCKQLDRFLESHEIRSILDRNLVIRKVNISEELRGNPERNTPGAQELAAKFGAEPNDGVPFLALANANGELIVNSNQPIKGNPHGVNIGYPSNRGEIDWFMTMLKKGAPSLTAGEAHEMESRLQKAVEENDQHRGSVPVPPAAGHGGISDFDKGDISAAFGSGWSVSTDSVVGGKSTADMRLISGGANGSKGALEVSGKVSEGFAYPWAGVLFSPGSAPLAPADLSSHTSIAFQAKGDGRSCSIMVYTKTAGFIPAAQTFSTGKEWKEFRFPLSSFNGTDGHDITGIAFAATMPAGEFSFGIDGVRLE